MTSSSSVKDISPILPVPLLNACNKKVLLRDVKTNNIPVERL
jgi:hypothetical protein